MKGAHSLPSSTNLRLHGLLQQAEFGDAPDDEDAGVKAAAVKGDTGGQGDAASPSLFRGDSTCSTSAQGALRRVKTNAWKKCAGLCRYRIASEAGAKPQHKRTQTNRTSPAVPARMRQPRQMPARSTSRP